MNIAERYCVRRLEIDYNFRPGLHARDDLPANLTEAFGKPRDWCIHWDYHINGKPFSVGRKLNNADLERIIGLNFFAYESVLQAQGIPYRNEVPKFTEYAIYVFPSEQDARRAITAILSGIGYRRLQLAREEGESS